MPQQKGKKILIYFFLFLVVCSINNISLNNLKFEKIKNINIIGLKEDYSLILLKEIKNLQLGNIFSINTKEIKNLISSHSLVENYHIYKKYPTTLDIKIEKTKFLARISLNKKLFLIGTNGKLSENIFSNNELPFIFGKPDIQDLLIFKRIIDQSKISYAEIKNLYFFSSKRWDIKVKDDIIIKLPTNQIAESLDLALEFLQNNDFKDIKIIDARVKNQIILND